MPHSIIIVLIYTELIKTSDLNFYSQKGTLCIIYPFNQIHFKGAINREIQIPLIFWHKRSLYYKTKTVRFRTQNFIVSLKQPILQPVCQNDSLWNVPI